MGKKTPQVHVEALMVSDVHCVAVDMTVRDAIGLFLKHGISGAPIVDSVKKVMSVVSQSDLMRLAATKGLKVTIGTNLNVLPPTEKLITIKRHAAFADLYKLMLNTPVHRIIVVDDNGRLQGLVSRSSVLRFLYGKDEGTAEEQGLDPADKPKKKTA